MKDIRVKLAFVGTILRFSENSYHRYKAGYTCAIIVCVLSLSIIIYMINLRLSTGVIFSIAIFLQAVMLALLSRIMKRDLRIETAEHVSYLPVIHLGLLIGLSLLFFYNGYSNYAAA